MNSIFDSLPRSWAGPLGKIIQAETSQQLSAFLAAEAEAGKVIYPAQSEVFNAFEATAFKAVKVVILGQDPYHGSGQAHGLSFSVPVGEKIPPSLRNIYKEINQDLGLATPSHGCLDEWSQRGVLLLNSILTVEHSQAGSHQGQGWEEFTDEVVAQLSQQREGIVFMLWGSYAQKKGRVIDRAKHCVLESAHPSPFSAHRGFLGNGHFSAANGYLESQGLEAIDWSLTDPQQALDL
ncbi:MAG: uracil-DNA glycosylase [Cellvibrionaceae bacterium]|nr:uracil-DNA glycosylase [Cellvibrionaceae bacterium]|tara:strand:- start:59720 stop:60427 length:708 start_codon:yes stop_codon:yes gene_type:complete